MDLQQRNLILIIKFRFFNFFKPSIIFNVEHCKWWEDMREVMRRHDDVIKSRDLNVRDNDNPDWDNDNPDLYQIKSIDYMN